MVIGAKTMSDAWVCAYNYMLYKIVYNYILMCMPYDCRPQGLCVRVCVCVCGGGGGGSVRLCANKALEFPFQWELFVLKDQGRRLLDRLPTEANRSL